MLERLSVEPQGLERAVPSASCPRSAPSSPCPRQSSASAWFAAALLSAIRVYQWVLSPLLGPCCRFEPSCSRYTMLCIERGGPWRGLFLGLRRLLRCHPFSAGGHDPPPEVSA